MKELSQECKRSIAGYCNTFWDEILLQKDDPEHIKKIATKAMEHALTSPGIYERAGLSPSVEWIPVSDKPKTSGFYLCWDINAPIPDKWEIYYYTKLRNVWRLGMDTYHPQYYMPLPSPPKQ